MAYLRLQEFTSPVARGGCRERFGCQSLLPSTWKQCCSCSLTRSISLPYVLDPQNGLGSPTCHRWWRHSPLSMGAGRQFALWCSQPIPGGCSVLGCGGELQCLCPPVHTHNSPVPYLRHSHGLAFVLRVKLSVMSPLPFVWRSMELETQEL